MSRPQLDVSDVLTDPDFCDSTLKCLRNSETVSEQGLTQISSATFPFSGVVTSERGDELTRGAEAERIGGTILVITRFRLRAAGAGNAADIVQWNDRQFTVVRVNDYSSYGAGFREVTCELVPLTG